MCESSVSHAEKIISRSTFDDWEVRCNEFQKTSRLVCDKSFAKRKDSTLARLETTVQTKWDTYNNESKLSDRIVVVSGWHETLQLCLEETRREEQVMTEVKSELERALQSLFLPLEVASTCVAFRDARQGAEITRDQVGVELQEELRVLELNKTRLLQLGAESWQMLDRLSSTYEALVLALSEQNKALNIDNRTLALNTQSPGLALRPEPCRLAPESCSPASWNSHCQILMDRQTTDCIASKKLRDEMLRAVETTRNAVLTQQETSQRALRERAFQLQRALDELEWQRQQLLEEMSRAQSEISRLRDTERSLDAPRRLCETRHEIRTSRPAGPERCQDPPQDGLAEESRRLEMSQRHMQLNIDNARCAYSSLRSQLARVELDVQDKQASLSLEHRCFATREQLYNTPHHLAANSHSAQL